MLCLTPGKQIIQWNPILHQRLHEHQAAEDQWESNQGAEEVHRLVFWSSVLNIQRDRGVTL